MTKLRVVGVQDVRSPSDFESSVSRSEERNTAAELEPLNRTDREVGSEIENRRAAVVELPTNDAFAQCRDARDALVWKMRRDPERDGNTEHFTGRSETEHEPMYR